MIILMFSLSIGVIAGLRAMAAPAVEDVSVIGGAILIVTAAR